MGGTYDTAPSAGTPTTMSGQMHVFYQLPVSPNNHSWSWKRDGRVPIIMIHGSQQTGANFLGTPDGRPGWAAYFVAHGWPVYVIDQPGRGKSGYFPNAYGPQAANPSPTTVKQQFTAPELTNPLGWPQASLHTQWPGGPGAVCPENTRSISFFASQVANMPNNDQALALTTAAVTALINKIGPASSSRTRCPGRRAGSFRKPIQERSKPFSQWSRRATQVLPAILLQGLAAD